MVCNLIPVRKRLVTLVTILRFWFLRKTQKHYKNVFILIQGVRYGATSDFPQQLTTTCLCPSRDEIFPAADSFCYSVIFGILGAFRRYMNAGATENWDRVCWLVVNHGLLSNYKQTKQRQQQQQQQQQEKYI